MEDVAVKHRMVSGLSEVRLFMGASTRGAAKRDVLDLGDRTRLTFLENIEALILWIQDLTDYRMSRRCQYLNLYTSPHDGAAARSKARPSEPPNQGLVYQDLNMIHEAG